MWVGFILQVAGSAARVGAIVLVSSGLALFRAILRNTTAAGRLRIQEGHSFQTAWVLLEPVGCRLWEAREWLDLARLIRCRNKCSVFLLTLRP